MKKRLIIYILSILTISLAGCTSSSTPYSPESFYMGTVINQKVYGKNAKTAGDKVIERMKEIEDDMTINKPGGEINALNEAAGKKSVKVSSQIMSLLNKAKQYGQLSQGAFDVTIGPLVKEWGIFTDNPQIPSQERIKELLPLVDYKTVQLDSAAGTAMLPTKGQMIDLGGIAKGYAGDEAIRIYKENGITSGFINLGGNVVVLGAKPDGTPWNIGVQNPRGVNGKIIGKVAIKDKALVSSGDYERYFEKDGVRYHHILDPKTGSPSKSGLIGVTIVADSSTDGDALSTSVFVLGLDKGMALVESLEGIDAIFITEDKKVYATSGLKDKFTFEDESKEYKYEEYVKKG